MIYFELRLAALLRARSCTEPDSKKIEIGMGLPGISLRSFLIAALAIVGIPIQALAADDMQAAMKADKTGTNPINFTYDARIYNEYQWLNTDGDGDQNITTLEFRAPIMDGKWQFRVKTRYQGIEADLNDDGKDDINESGWGDTDIRFLTVPYMADYYPY